MNGLITEGIPLGIDVQILTGGLSFEGPPPPTPGVPAGSSSLSTGVKYLLALDTVYAIPPGATSITFQTTTPGNVDIYGSLDSIHWGIIASFTFSNVITIQTGVVFIQAVSENLTAQVYAMPRREKL